MRRVLILRLILIVVVGGLLTLVGITGSKQISAYYAHIWGLKLFLGRQQGMSVEFNRARVQSELTAFLTLHSMWTHTSPHKNYWVETGYMNAIPALVAGTNRPWDFVLETWYYWAEATPTPGNPSQERFRTTFVQPVGYDEYPLLHAGADHATGEHKWSVYLLNLSTYEYIIPKSNLTYWTHGPYADDGGLYGGETYDTVSWLNQVHQIKHNYHQVYPPYNWLLIPNDDGEMQNPPWQVAWVDPPQGEDWRDACVALNPLDGDCPSD